MGQKLDGERMREVTLTNEFIDFRATTRSPIQVHYFEVISINCVCAAVQSSYQILVASWQVEREVANLQLKRAV